MNQDTGGKVPGHSRLAVVVGVERVALALRYAIYVIAATLFLLGQIRGEMSDLLVITAVVVAHSLFTHWVLARRRYDLFLTWRNFLIHFLEISLVVYLTGAEESDAYVLYILLVIGSTAYKPRFSVAMGLTLLCMASYGIIITIEAATAGLRMMPGMIVVKFLALLSSGWLIGWVSGVLARTEEDAFQRAQELASSEATLRTILNGAAEPIIVFDESEAVTEVNEKACEFLGLDRREVLGRRFRSFVFDDGTLPGKMAALRTRGEYHGELTMLRADGEERTVSFRVSSFYKEGAHLYVLIAHDITDRKSLEHMTRTANVNLARLNRELAQLNRLRTEFMRDIGRKLRSPLSAVLGYLDMMVNDELGELNEEQKTAAQNCRDSARKALSITDEALDVAVYRDTVPGEPRLVPGTRDSGTKGEGRSD